MVTYSDTEIVALLRAGNDDGVVHLLNRYHAALLAYAYRMLGDRQAAEDVVQDSFIRFLDRLWQLRKPEKLRSYLYQIVTHCCHDYWREPARRREVITSSIPRTTSQETAEASNERFYLAALLRELPAPYAEVLILRYYEDMDLATIALVLKLPLGTVKSRLHYALRRLRQLIHTQRMMQKTGVLAHEH